MRRTPGLSVRLHPRTVPIFQAVETSAIESALDRAETALAEGEGLSGTGFWKAVSTVKRHPDLVDRYAARISAVDAQAHRSWAQIVLPFWAGTLLALGGFVLGLFGVGLAYSLDGVAAVVVFLLGLVALLGTTHGLGHLLVGSLMGIRFSAWYMVTATRPQPGIKVDYASYLRTPPRQRAWMHASGALATKLVPFLGIGAAVAAELPKWLVWGLAGFGVLAVVTDFVWSTKSSDWKRFSREMRIAQEV
jgi:hypothetical protein